MVEQKRIINSFLNQGAFPLGTTVNEVGEKLYFPNEPTHLLAPKLFIGNPSETRQQQLQHYLSGTYQLGHCSFVFESNLSDQGLFESLEETIGANGCQRWDFSSSEVMSTFSFDYEELYLDWEATDFQKRWDLATLLGEHLYRFLSSLTEVCPSLSISEKLLFHTIVKTVFVHPHQTLYSVYQVLTDYETRKAYIVKGLEERNEAGESLLDEFDLDVLKQLNETCRQRDDYTGEWREVETGETYARIAQPLIKLFNPFLINQRIRGMFRNPSSSMFNLTEGLTRKQLIFVRLMKPFYSEEARALMVNFLVSKLYLCQLLGQIHEGVSNQSKENENVSKEVAETNYPIHLLFEEFSYQSLTMKYISKQLKEFSNADLSVDLVIEDLRTIKSYLTDFTTMFPSYFFVGPIDACSFKELAQKLPFIASSKKRNELVSYVPFRGEYEEVKTVLSE